MLAFLGGTGPEGRGLALRFALLGNDVVIGSRDVNRAREAAAAANSAPKRDTSVSTEFVAVTHLQPAQGFNQLRSRR